MKIEIITNEKLAESVYIYKHQSGLEVRVLPKEGYDSVYSNLLKSLAEIKRKYENAYKLNLIPSTTTEAYNAKEDAKIEENHFKIRSCNFKNRACATNDFAKKYTHLKHVKYAGIPIGDFVIFENNVPKTYELNIIYKNLSDSLAKY